MALVLRVVGAGLTFVLSLALARIVGAEGAGLFFLAYGVVTIAGVVARLGLGGPLVRFTSGGAAVEDWSSIRSLVRRALTLGAVAAVVVAGVLYAFAPWRSETAFDEPRLTEPLRIMLLSVLPLVLLSLLGQFLRGRKRIAQAVAVMAVLPPAFTCLGIVLLAPAAGARGAAAAYLAATLLTLVLATVWWRYATPRWSGAAKVFPLRTLLASSMPLFWTALFKVFIERSPALFLGLFAPAAEVGILQVANRTALLVSFILLALDTSAGPKFAELYRTGNIEMLSHTARRSAMLSLSAALPLVLLLVAVPGFVMRLFGESFTAGASILVILSLGQLVNAATGPVTMVLVMSGHERAMRNVTGASLLVSVALYLGLTPIWGMHGAAVAGALTLAFQNLVAVFTVRSALGIWVLPSPLMSRRERGRGGKSE